DVPPAHRAVATADLAAFVDHPCNCFAACRAESVRRRVRSVASPTGGRLQKRRRVCGRTRRPPVVSGGPQLVVGVFVPLLTSFRSGYLFSRPLCNRGVTQGSEGDKFSVAQVRANRLSSAAVCKLSLCLIFSQWVSTVLRLR